MRRFGLQLYCLAGRAVSRGELKLNQFFSGNFTVGWTVISFFQNIENPTKTRVSLVFSRLPPHPLLSLSWLSWLPLTLYFAGFSEVLDPDDEPRRARSGPEFGPVLPSRGLLLGHSALLELSGNSLRRLWASGQTTS
jgi:hypothetical protein